MAKEADRVATISRSHPGNNGDAENNAAAVMGDAGKRKSSDVDGKTDASRS